MKLGFVDTVMQFIVDSWEKHFAEKTDRKVAIYGIGKYTGDILERFPSPHVVGLLDGSRADGMIYGKPIVTIEQAVALGVDTVVIVAQANNVRIIYRRIADACAANSIEVYDINGNLVGPSSLDMKKTFEKYAGMSAPILKEKIDRADVVSFDIFDTLIMRRALYPRDIFSLAERQLGAGFYERRVDAEMGLYKEGKHPNIYDIYDRLGGLSPEVEIELESRFLIRREAMVEMLQYARRAGKRVYLVSDMYLPKQIMKGFLDGLDIPIDMESILVSCDCGVSKEYGLFKVLRALAGATKILHIGDNFAADIESARRYGIDDTFHIEKAQVMLDDGYASDLLKYETSLANRLLIGEFIGRQLNDPFLFSQTPGRFSISGEYEMAYALLAPLVYRFFGWLVKQARELRLERVLLSSRDGFIMQQIYEVLRDRGVDLPRMDYFYTSRISALLAGVVDDASLLYAAKINYSGETGDMLKWRFNLSDGEILPRNDLDEDEYILLHRGAVMRRAEAARENYRAYIDTLGIPRGAKVGLFDFFSSGSCLKSLGNFVGFDLVGLLCAFDADFKQQYKDGLQYEAMFGDVKRFETSHNIIGIYLFLENIFTSDEPTLKGFDDGGSLVFMKEHRTAEQLRTLGEIHAAILDYVENVKFEFDDLAEMDKEVPDFLLKLFRPQYSRIDTDYFDGATLVDELRNLAFDVSQTNK